MLWGYLLEYYRIFFFWFVPYFIAWAGTIGTINYFLSPFKQEDSVFLLIVEVGFRFNLLEAVI